MRPRFLHLSALLVALTAQCVSGGGMFAGCKEATKGLASTAQHSDNQLDVTFHNRAQKRLKAYWVNFEGAEVLHRDSEAFPPESSMNEGTHPGHVYRFRDVEGRVFLEYTVPSKSADGSTSIQVDIPHCGPPYEASHARDGELGGLVHDQSAACEPASDSSKWSCLRCLSPEAVRARDPALYGFHEGEPVAGHKPGDTWDTNYVHWIPYVPVLTQGPGFLKMNFTKEMRELLEFWQRNKNKVSNEGIIGGGYANDRDHPIHFLSLDYYLDMRNKVSGEMHDVLEWWTGVELQHQATYGIRVYQRESMLVDHVDRMETHLASAVIQVDQEVDKMGGWPLEVYKTDGTLCEVYLQPGEMVLYEGARIRHGRPMRFRGTSFANVFSHFSPITWHGEETIKENKKNSWKTEREQFL